jgi:hypothetical protein
MSKQRQSDENKKDTEESIKVHGRVLDPLINNTYNAWFAAQIFCVHMDVVSIVSGILTAD